MSRRRPIALYLPGAEDLAKKTHQKLGLNWQLIPIQTQYFADGEAKVMLPPGEENSVRGADTYVMQAVSFGYPHSRQDLFFELCSALAMLTECDACYRTAVTPWYYYACQDKPRQREPLSARLAADMLTVSGATHVISVDVHNDAIKGFFDRRQCNFMGLYASGALLRHLNGCFHISDDRGRFVISGVDEGSGNRIKHLAKHTGLMPVLPTKVRDYKTGKVKEIIIREPVKGKTAVIWDDMIRSAGTIIETARALRKKGAKEVLMVASHANFCGNAVADLEALHHDGFLSAVICSDSFHFAPEFHQAHPWFQQVSLDGILAETMSNIHNEKSVSRVYLDDRGIQ